MSTKGYTNNSNNLRNLITMPGYKDDIGGEVVEADAQTMVSQTSQSQSMPNIPSFKNFVQEPDQNRRQSLIHEETIDQKELNHVQ